jgi:hypothetical protein
MDSLAKRGDLPAPISALLWARYLLDATAGSEGCLRSMLAYGDLMDDWRQAITQAFDAIGLDLRADAEQAARIDAFLRPQLRHHRADAGSAAGLLQPLSALSTGTLDPGARQQVVHAFEQAAAPVIAVAEAYAGLLADSRKQAVQARREADGLYAAMDEQGRWARQLDDESQALLARYAALVTEHEQSVQWTHSVERELEAAQATYRAAEQDRDEKLAWVESLKGELAAMQSTFRAAERDRDEKLAWVDSLKAELVAMQSTFRAAEADRNEKLAWVESLKAELSSLQSTFRAAEAEREEKLAWVESLKGELASLETKFRAAQQDRDEKL